MRNEARILADVGVSGENVLSVYVPNLPKHTKVRQVLAGMKDSYATYRDTRAHGALIGEEWLFSAGPQVLQKLQKRFGNDFGQTV